MPRTFLSLLLLLLCTVQLTLSRVPTTGALTIMSRYQPSDWNAGQKAGLVDIGTHKLYLQVSGPDRQPHSPAIIIIPGLASSTTGWAAVSRLLSPKHRIYSYERSRYGASEPSPNLPTSVTIAQELDLLLKSAQIQPPYVIIAHSWAGILSREFLALPGRVHDVAGIVFIEANQEHTLEILDWRQPALAVMRVGVDFINATGLAHTNKLTAEEWDLYRKTEDSASFQAQAALEFNEYADSFPLLAEKDQLHLSPLFLGEKPVCVIKGDNKSDQRKMYDAGVALGNGNATERERYLEILESWDGKDGGLQREILSLTGEGGGRYLQAERGAGHHVQLTKPEIIVEGVEWVMKRLGEGGC